MNTAVDAIQSLVHIHYSHQWFLTDEVLASVRLVKPKVIMTTKELVQTVKKVRDQVFIQVIVL